ncbi:MAG TPA: hypothetical protein PLU22_18745 [Polyangiaceae bacterium]|nr:hypothetical protein [Polyangiaceae bacterium]
MLSATRARCAHPAPGAAAEVVSFPITMRVEHLAVAVGSPDEEGCTVGAP